MTSGFVNIGYLCTVLLVGLPLARAQDLPPEWVTSLSSPEFQEREDAQAKLLGWGRARGDEALDQFLDLSQDSDDPETRARCLWILRELVNDEFMKEGEGYMGINLVDEFLDIPGEAGPRNVIRVIWVQPGSPAERAGLRLNDLIVGVGGSIWPEPVFREKIKKMKPNDEVEIQALRAGGPISLRMKLGRRPSDLGIGIFNPPNEDMAAVERAASEAYFRRWLSRKKEKL